jgi:squalene-hopene/tetraprenyl-beta-curcumene cyclase
MSAWFGTERNEAAQGCLAWLRETLTRSPEELLTTLDAGTFELIWLAFHLADPSHDAFAVGDEHKFRLVGTGTIDNVARTYLAVFNQISFDACDPHPPEWYLLSARWRQSAARQTLWSQATGVPLSILLALRPRKISVPPQTTSGLLTGAHLRDGMSVQHQPLGYRASLTIARLLERWGITPFRTRAMRSARRWLLTRACSESGIVGCPSATALAAIALSCLGFERTSPAITRCFEALDRHLTPSGGMAARRVPNSDTALSIHALAGTHVDDAVLDGGVESLLRQETDRQGDWAATSEAEPGGWSAEHNNPLCPEVPCTAMSLIAMRTRFGDSPTATMVTDDSMVAMIRANTLNAAKRKIAVLDRAAAASRRARRWVLAMQNPNGSWGTTDREVRRRFAEWQIPGHLADQRVMAPANTGLVLQALGCWQIQAGQGAIDRAVSYLRDHRTAGGTWGPTGPLELYSTWCVISGLRAVGIHGQGEFAAASDSMLSRQLDDGSWQYADGLPGGRVLDTSWALLALLASECHDQEPLGRAAQCLIDRQAADGCWSDGRGMAHQHLQKLLPVSHIAATGYALLALSQWKASQPKP